MVLPVVPQRVDISLEVATNAECADELKQARLFAHQVHLRFAWEI